MHCATTIRHSLRPVPLCAALLALAAGSAALADNTSAGANGCNARVTGLTGAGINIGQVELGRPGRTGLDANGEWYWDNNNNNAHDAGESFVDWTPNGIYNAGFVNAHPDVQPAAVFEVGKAAPLGANRLSGAGPGPGFFATPNQYYSNYWNINDPLVDNHATQVAGVMVGSLAGNLGVASGATLYSAAFFQTADRVALGTQWVQQQADVRAVNHSYGARVATPDGSNARALALDYFSRHYDTSHVVAGDEAQNPPSNPGTPSDAFNVINVAFLRQNAGIFNQVDPGNIATVGANNRRLVMLCAPGRDINMPSLGGGYSNSSGTSFAAPHVTGAIAQLQQFGKARFDAGTVGWDLSYRRHWVMKSILMNSADKVQDNTGWGGLLGMQKTVTDTNGQTWLQSEAFNNPTIPLDDQMGAGALNVGRALTQYSAGEFNTFQQIPYIGWADGLTGGVNGVGGGLVYQFANSLVAGSYAAVTLCWDRQVTLNDADNNNLYSSGESFTDAGVAEMSLFLEELVPGGGGWQAVYAELSTVNNVQHIFNVIPNTGTYRIRVSHSGGLNQATDFGLAWWTIPSPGAAPLLALAGLFASRRRRSVR